MVSNRLIASRSGYRISNPPLRDRSGSFAILFYAFVREPLLIHDEIWGCILLLVGGFDQEEIPCVMLLGWGGVLLWSDCLAWLGLFTVLLSEVRFLTTQHSGQGELPT